MIYIGIDPGKDGAIAAIDNDRAVLCIEMAPVVVVGPGTKRDYNVNEMAELVAHIRNSVDGNVVAVLEKQQAMPGQGVASMFSIGRGFGLWEGILAARDIPYRVVHPRTWKKNMLRDSAGDKSKGRSIVEAGRLFPKIDLRRSVRSKKPHDGKAEALLMAAYAFEIFATS